MSRGRENFPVGSLLVRRDLRRAVHAFYAVARAADDAADDPGAPARERLAALAAMEAGLAGERGGAPEGLRLRAELMRLGRPGGLGEARLLLEAFRFDVRDGRIETLEDLLAYCEASANPVGRFLLDLHGEGAAAVGPSDALCTALQILNHLQDLRADHLTLGRRYLPGRWMEEAGATDADLGRDALTPALRAVVLRTLHACDGLLARAGDLPGRIGSRRLAGEAATILWLARRLADRLRDGDPLAGRVAPGRLDFARAAGAGVARALAGPARTAWREGRA